jgi:cobalt-zinc-cadmium efflux system outer membrane protein
MSMRAQVRTCLAALTVLLPSLGAAQERTAREVLELILREGPQAVAIRSASEVVRHEQLARLAYPNPSVTFSREGAGFTEFLQAEQSLWLFGTRSALSRAGVAATESAEADRDAQLWVLRSEAALAVVRVVAQQVRYESTRADLQEIERLVNILRTREREGEGSRFDRLRAEQELREVRQTATEAAVGLADARTAVTGLLPEGVTFDRIAGDVAPQAPPMVPSMLWSRAESSRAELKALERSAQRAVLEADAARRQRLPSPGVSAALPLFDSGARDAARWSAEKARADAARAAIAARVRNEVTGAADVLSLRLAALAEDDPSAGLELQQIAEVAYREGEVGILEWLDAVRTASRARLRGIELRLDARLAQIALERAVGDVLWP